MGSVTSRTAYCSSLRAIPNRTRRSDRSQQENRFQKSGPKTKTEWNSWNRFARDRGSDARDERRVIQTPNAQLDPTTKAIAHWHAAPARPRRTSPQRSEQIPWESRPEQLPEREKATI